MEKLVRALAMIALVLLVAGVVIPAEESPVPTEGLSLWLNASTGVTAADGRVSLWADQSAGKLNAAQEEPDSQPLLVNDAVAGKPALRFDGEDDFLTFEMPVNDLTGMTIFLVSANSEDRTGGVGEGCGCRAQNCAIFWNETQSWGTVYLSPFQSQVNYRFGTTATGNWPVYERPESIGNAHSVTVSRKDGATDALYVKGTMVMSQEDQEPAIAGCQDTGNIGRGYNDDTFFPGDIAEVLVYNRALPDAERQTVEQYLMTRYPVTASGN
jgi:hypothetical protein